MLELTRVQTLLVSLGLTALVALGAGATGYHLGYGHADAEGAVRLGDYRLAATAQALHDEQANRAREQVLTATANQLGWQLLHEQAAHQQTAITLKGQVDRVTRQYRQALDAPAEPLPRCVFTAGFVRVWNDAHGLAGDGELSQAHAAAGTAATADAAAELDSGVSQADVLAHHIDTAQRCRDTASQLNRLIDWQEAVAQ